MQTYSGRTFFPLRPTADTIHIEDIAERTHRTLELLKNRKGFPLRMERFALATAVVDARKPDLICVLVFLERLAIQLALCHRAGNHRYELEWLCVLRPAVVCSSTVELANFVPSREGSRRAAATFNGASCLVSIGSSRAI